MKFCTGIMLMFLASFAWSANLTVTVNDANGNALAGVDVAAISFSSMGPVAASPMAQTDSAGKAVLSLTADQMYQVIAVKAGYVPSARDQMFNWTSSVNAGTSDASKTIQLRPAVSSDKVRDIKITVTHDVAAGNLLFLNLMNKGTFEPAGMGFYKSTGAGAAVCYVYSAPVSDDSSFPFQLDVYDPVSRRGDRIAVNNQADTTENNAGTLNISSSSGAMGPPKKQVVTEEKLGDITFEGMVYKAEDISGIESVDVMLNGDNGSVNLQTQTDENGYFAFYQSKDSSGNSIIQTGHEYNINFMKQGRVGNNQQKIYAGYKSTMTVIMPEAAGKIKGVINVVVGSQSTPIPQAMVNAWPDWNNYGAQNSIPDMKPGMGNANSSVNIGTFLLEGLPSGRYQLNVWSEFNNQPVNYNWGSDGASAAGNDMSGQGVSDWKDDYIVEIDTTVSIYAKVINAKDRTPVTLTNNTIEINIVKTVDGTNSITGQVTFTGASAPDPSSVLIVARQNYTAEGTAPKSGFTILKTADKVSDTVYSYTIAGLADGTYRVEIKAPNFGVKVANDGARTNENITLSASGKTTTEVNFTMAPAGIIEGFLRTPKGTVFLPNFGQNYMGAFVDANSEETNCWGSAQVDKNGNFKIEGLLPGKYNLRANGNGTAYSYASAILKSINVESGKTVKVEIPLRNGVKVHPALSESLPADMVAALSEQKADVRIVYTAANVSLTAKNIDEVFQMGSGGDQSNIINYWGGNFQQVSLEPGAYNFYLTYEEMFPMYADNYSKTIIGKAKNVVIDSSKQTDQLFMYGSSITVQNIPITLNIGTCTFSGTYSGNNTLREADMQIIEKNFNTFLTYVPRVTLIDNDGNILATGMCTPSAAIIRQLDKGSDKGSEFVNKMKEYMNSSTYGLRLLQPQSNIKAVITTPNYPPLLRTVNVSSTLNIDMDADAGSGANITGAVHNTTGQVIAGAAVRIKGKLLDRSVKTQTDGTFLVPGLASGVYRLSVTAPGYNLEADKVIIGTENKIKNFILTACAGSIEGTIYSQKFPYPLIVTGAKIVAYDDTANGLDPAKELAIYETVSANDGTYKIWPVIEGHTYKVALVVPGKSTQILSASVPSVAGSSVTGVDFTYKSMAPKVKMVVRPNTDGSLTITGESPKKLITLTAKYNEGTTYTDSSASALTVTKVGDKIYTVTLADKTKAYAVRFTADDGAGNGNIDIVYDPNNLAHSMSNIDQEIAASGDILIDSQGNDTSGLYISPGAITLGDNSIPSLVMKKEKLSSSAYAAALPANTAIGDIYNISLAMDGSQQNEDKTITLSVGYDPRLVGQNLNALRVSQYNSATGTWDVIPGEPMVDPINGTVSVEIKSIVNATGTSASQRKAAMAVFDGKEFKLSPKQAVSSDQQGLFVVSKIVTAPTYTQYTGSSLEVFNVPNPFNLNSKTITLNRGGSTSQMTTQGTLIRFAVPSQYGTNVKALFRIYNIAGELVRELNASDNITGGINGGYYYYLEWDGKNSNAQKCASGVYFCTAEVGTEKKVIKMALIK